MITESMLNNLSRAIKGPFAIFFAVAQAENLDPDGYYRGTSEGLAGLTGYSSKAALRHVRAMLGYRVLVGSAKPLKLRVNENVAEWTCLRGEVAIEPTSKELYGGIAAFFGETVPKGNDIWHPTGRDVIEGTLRSWHTSYLLRCGLSLASHPIELHKRDLVAFLEGCVALSVESGKGVHGIALSLAKIMAEKSKSGERSALPYGEWGGRDELRELLRQHEADKVRVSATMAALGASRIHGRRGDGE